MDGETVYWYSTGDIYSHPEGKLLVKVEGFDATRAVVAGPTLVHQLSRKVFIFRDKDSGEVLSQYNDTSVSPIKYAYQHTTYRLDNNRLLTEVTGGEGEPLQTLRGNVVSLKHLQSTTSMVFTCPVFLNFKTPQGEYLVYENHDYFMDKVEEEEVSTHCSTVRVGHTPPFAESAVMHLVGWRADTFAMLPPSIQDYIAAEEPMWKEAPVDIDDVKQLQQ
eukprot:SM000026S08990  [mRNA]  locus=s26:987747:988702:+ [translate_table: standard]